MENTVNGSMVNPLDNTGQDAEKRKGSDFLKEIVSNETREGAENLLDFAPEVDDSLIQDIRPQKSLLLLVLKIVFAVLAVSWVAAVLFFTSQLSDKFDFLGTRAGIPNVSRNLGSTNSEVLNVQTDLNFYRYLGVKAYLDEFSFYGDAFIQNYEVANSQTADEGDRRDAQEEMTKLRAQLKTSFGAAKEKYITPFEAALFSLNEVTPDEVKLQFEEKLKTKLTDQAATFVNNPDAGAQADYKNFIHTINLIGNTALKSLMVETDFDSLSDEEVYSLVKNVNAVIVNDLSLIQEIKNSRIKWSDIINEIELRTIEVDRYHADNFYQDIGGIRYMSYDFDSGKRKINIDGETMSFDTTNFTMIANLIDELNSSPIFKNAEMRSFTKSGSVEAGYVASLKLSVDLEEEEGVEEVPVTTPTN